MVLLRLLWLLIRVWPTVVEVVRTVEAMNRAESGEVKKTIAKRYLQEKLSSPFPRMSEKDWDNLIGGLIDVAVALLNTFWPKWSQQDGE